MKHIINKLLLITLLLLGSSQAFAGSGHSHTVSKTTIEMNAKRHLQKMITQQKIPSSWQNASLIDMRLQGILSNEWIVSFENKAITNNSQSIIYVYVTTYGKIKGANYNGQ